MAIDQKTRAYGLLGKRIELPVHYDMWMRGARFGRVVSAHHEGAYIKVKLDNRRRYTVITCGDYDYIKILGEPQS